MDTLIRLEPSSFATLIIMAMRYAHGRMSVAPSFVADLVISHLDDIPTASLEQIVRETESELRRAEGAGTFLGHQCDHATWVTLVRSINQYLQGREVRWPARTDAA